MEDPAETAYEDPSFWQLHAGALWLNGLVIVTWGLCALATQVGHEHGYGPLLVFILALALGTLGNFIGLVVNLFTRRYDQAAAYGLALLLVGSLFWLCWMSLGNIGKPPGG